MWHSSLPVTVVGEPAAGGSCRVDGPAQGHHDRTARQGRLVAASSMLTMLI